MTKQILFIQGGGDDGYKEDQPLVASLKTILGKGYDIQYPEMQSDESAADFGWTQQIGQKIAECSNDVILVGHSLGASMLLKYLSENSVHKKIAGVFLAATPFWGGSEEWQAGLKLQEGFADKLPPAMPIYFYHCQDDEVVPFAHLNIYKKTCTQGVFRTQKHGGHQFNNDLTMLAKDLQSL